MSLLALVVLAAAKLHDPHLVALAVRLDGRGDLATIDEGLAELDVGALADEEHLAEFNRRALRLGQFLDPLYGAFLHAILLAAGRYHRKHLSSPQAPVGSLGW